MGRLSADAQSDGADRHGREPSLAPDQTKGESKVLRENERVLPGCVRDDSGKSAQEHDGPARTVFVAQPVDQDKRHFLSVLVAVRGWVQLQRGAEHRTRPPFRTRERHGYRLLGTRPLALASASSRVSLAASDSATRRPSVVRR